jgi:hypothetical protein
MLLPIVFASLGNAKQTVPQLYRRRSNEIIAETEVVNCRRAQEDVC